MGGLPLLRLTERQKKIAGMLDAMECVADIGCDHGRLGAYLIQSGLAQRVIASDISENSLNKARNLARRLNIEDKMQFRLGDGLGALDGGEAQAAVISGLSGMTITGIMQRGGAAGRIYVLQPMSEAFKLRRALLDMGYEILDEAVAAEYNGRQRFYEIIKCRWDGLKRSGEEKYLYIPRAPLIRRDAEMKGFLEHRLLVCEKALDSIKHAKNNRKAEALEKQRKFYKEGLVCLE